MGARLSTFSLANPQRYEGLLGSREVSGSHWEVLREGDMWHFVAIPWRYRRAQQPGTVSKCFSAVGCDQGRFAVRRLQCDAGGVASRVSAGIHHRHKYDEPKQQRSQDQHSIGLLQWHRTESPREDRNLAKIARHTSSLKTSRAQPRAVRTGVFLCGRPESHAKGHSQPSQDLHGRTVQH